MTIKQFGKIFIVPCLIALTPVPIWAQADTQTTTPRSSGRAQTGGDAAVTGQTGTDVRQNGGQSTPTSSAGMAASSQEIATLQQALKDRGQDPGAVNGVMTPQTQQALKNFQAQQGLNATGTLDAQSRTALGVGLGGGSSAAGAGAGNSLGTGTGTPIDPTLTPGQDTLPGSSARGTSAPTPSTGLGTQSPSTLPGGTTGSSLPGASTGSTLLPGGTSGSIGGTTGSGTGSTRSVGGSGGIGGTGGGAGGGAAGGAGGAGGGR
ncbi:MAG TPA: peptidoglycan-binding domain-containing protein [Candidatus Binatia bacterium]|nr:peptidoglycan-binding domain-containing protein [Candidatus Binatia bacterium]